jgi:hypothetical protein
VPDRNITKNNIEKLEQTRDVKKQLKTEWIQSKGKEE